MGRERERERAVGMKEQRQFILLKVREVVVTLL